MSERNLADSVINDSYGGLAPEVPNNRPPKLLKLPPINSQLKGLSNPSKRLKQMRVPKGYELSDFTKAIKHWYSQSYARKILRNDGSQEYEELSIFDDCEELKQYGLGIYLYMRLIKQLLYVCFFISLFTLIPLIFCYQGSGLETYQDSFTITLAKFSLGNINNGDQLTYFMIVISDIMTMIVLFVFYFRWRAFHAQCQEELEKNHLVLNPSTYALSVAGFDPKTQNLEKQLIKHFERNKQSAYEVEVVTDFKRKFDYFIDLEEKVEKVEKQRQVIRQTDKDDEELKLLEKELEKQEKKVLEVAGEFEPLGAIVLFRTLKAKYKFVNVCKKHALMDKFMSKVERCICCREQLPQDQKFMGKNEILIKRGNLPRPEEINWNNIDISWYSRLGRYLASIVLMAISIFLTSSLIAFCTLYVSSTASCDNFDDQTTLSQALAGDQSLLYCYCSANFVDFSIDSQIGSACHNLRNQILITNIVQIGSSLVSALTNVVLIIVVSLIAEHLLKPESKPQEFSFTFVAVLLSNYLNSALLPLILNGNIYGFNSLNYLKFVQFINFDTVSIFKDLDRDWYAVISPYYLNFFLFASINSLTQLLMFAVRRKIILWFAMRKCQNNDPNHLTIQKEVDQIITKFPLDFPADMSVLTLQLFMCFMYSGLIPLSMPIFTFGLFLTVLCKRYIIYHYSVKIPANQNLNQKFINIIPFMIVMHGFMSVWAHTTQGIFDDSVFLSILDFQNNSLHPIMVRGLKDIIQLMAIAIVIAWIVFDWTLVAFYNFVQDCCKEQLKLPESLATQENRDYGERLRSSNILGSYKLSNNPTFSHAYTCYKQVKERAEKIKDHKSDVPMCQDQII